MSKYTCHTKHLGPAPRNAPYEVKCGYTVFKINDSSHKLITTRTHTTPWDNIICGHITSNLDQDCVGCKCAIK